MALRDYKKGKYLLENRPGQLLPIGNTKDSAESEIAEQHQRRVLDKVWSTVEKAMGEMRNILISQLQDSSRSVEEQEKTLEYAFLCLMGFSLMYAHILGCFWNCNPMTILSGRILTAIIETYSIVWINLTSLL
jgi:hypothetical protein